MSLTLRHLPHLLMLVVPFALFAVIFLLEWRSSAGPRPPRRRPDGYVVAMAVTALGSTAVHVAVVPEHFAASPVLGWFFVALSLGQLGFIVLLLITPVRRVVVAGVLGHLAVVLLWAWTRTLGVPFGLGGVDPVALPDLLATGFEVLCVLSGLVVVYRATGGRPSLEVRTVSKCDRSTTRNSPLPWNVSV